MENTPKPSPDGLMLGVGLDNQDGHKRVTKGDNFYLVGGSEETHERMKRRSRSMRSWRAKASIFPSFLRRNLPKSFVRLPANRRPPGRFAILPAAGKKTNIFSAGLDIRDTFCHNICVIQFLKKYFGSYFGGSDAQRRYGRKTGRPEIIAV